MGNCVRVARQTLTLFVRVRILLPQPSRGVAQLGRALRSGRRGRGSNPVTSTTPKENRLVEKTRRFFVIRAEFHQTASFQP